MSDPKVLALREKMTAIPSPELTVARPARQATLEIRTRDGKQFLHHTIAVRGTPSNPMPPENVKTKAQELIAPILGDAPARALINAVWTLEDLVKINALSGFAQGA